MRRSSSAPGSAQQSALARLLEVESRLEAMLEEARAESAALLEGAAQRAERRHDSLAAELAAADAELSARLAVDAETRIAEEEAELAAVRARYEAVDEAAAAEHARWLVERVLRMAAEASP
ncbi:MAG TPA: hypothetical protein PKA66_09725 [Gemmatimonadales bacterium]|nr:hypothetical protein [Gemmatimonadales bacterium]